MIRTFIYVGLKAFMIGELDQSRPCNFEMNFSSPLPMQLNCSPQKLMADTPPRTKTGSVSFHRAELDLDPYGDR
jgi:hypothetical protein